MAKSLVIVESPSKAKTINKYLGKDYVVEASIGHIIDLPKSRIGINFEKNFELDFQSIYGKKDLIKKLQEKASSADQVFIASDPDREGEAIAWHIESALKEYNKNIYRVEFHEITRNAVEEAIAKPRKVDLNRVYAQHARRALDRIVGYKVSPFLWNSVYKGLSAGRVQSVALRLICEREEEISKFIPEEFWTFKGDFLHNKKSSILCKLEKISEKKVDVKNKIDADKHAKNINSATYKITNIVKKTLKRQPVPPFITSTLQQEAVRKLRMTSKRVMATAQSLYEGVDIGKLGQVGLITYMRTDSVRIGDDALTQLRNFVSKTYGNDQITDVPRVFKTKSSAQDAHEAIRPTHIEADYDPEKIKDLLNNDQYRLYKLIWNRFVATQMVNAEFDKTTVDIEGGDYLFRASGETMKVKGYLAVYDNLISDDEEDENNPIPPDLKINDAVDLKKLVHEQNFTKPTPRYNEATIIKELDEQGIGRPSTYASIITTLIDRLYIKNEERKLFATDLGMTVNKILVKQFPDIFNVKFTAHMESQLDEIEGHNTSYLNVMNEFYTPFAHDLDLANKQSKDIKSTLQEETDIICDKDGGKMVIKMSRNGKFLACSNYPKCKNTKPLESASTGAVEVNYSEHICEKDQGRMIIKKGPYGNYLACENYPTCKNTKPVPSGITCPKCLTGHISGRKSKKGRMFYGCSNYPKCDFISWTAIVNKECPSCKNPYMNKKTLKKGDFLNCPVCKHEIALVTEKET